MSYTIDERVILETVNCCACGTTFAMQQTLKKARMDNGGVFWCPNGHEQIYTKPRCEKLKDELAEKQRELTAARCEALNEKQKREATEAEMTRHKKRMKNGVCPCCQRSFINLKRHIATKHPQFAT